jgi:hypothetical protein
MTSPDEPPLSSTEGLDEDELAADPLEGGEDRLNDGRPADRLWGTTPFEQSRGEPLDRRLAREEPTEETTDRDRG